MSKKVEATAVVYEVNLDVDIGIIAAYRDWLREHVREMLAMPGFIDARILDVREPAPEPGRIALSVQYRLRDMAALDAYLREPAPAMRADGIARFGDRFRASRRILQAAD